MVGSRGPANSANIDIPRGGVTGRLKQSRSWDDLKNIECTEELKAEIARNSSTSGTVARKVKEEHVVVVPPTMEGMADRIREEELGEKHFIGAYSPDSRRKRIER